MISSANVNNTNATAQHQFTYTYAQHFQRIIFSFFYSKAVTVDDSQTDGRTDRKIENLNNYSSVTSYFSLSAPLKGITIPPTHGSLYIDAVRWLYTTS